MIKSELKSAKKLSIFFHFSLNKIGSKLFENYEKIQQRNKDLRPLELFSPQHINLVNESISAI
jgi:hypothetical protein